MRRSCDYGYNEVQKHRGKYQGKHYDTNWDGGTRNKYMALQYDGSFNAFNAPSPWTNKEEGKDIDMVPGMMIVMHTIFCGKDIGITIYIHPANAPKWIEGE